MHFINHIGYAAFIGLISVMLWTCYASEMTLCTDDSMPCVLRYGETQKVCAGESVYTNMTLRVPSTTSPQNITILVQGHQFSKGPFVSGRFHDGDNHISRWKNRISFQGNNMTYETWNSKIEYKDEFESDLQIDIEGERFTSKPFKWYDVENCIPATEPESVEKDTLGQTLANITEQLGQMRVSIDALATEMLEVKDSNNQSLKSRLESLKNIGIADIIVSIFHLFATILIMLIIKYMLAGIKGQLETQVDDRLPSSHSSDNSQVQNTDTERGSTPSNLTDLNASSNTHDLERPRSLLSLAPQDEVENGAPQDEIETAGL